MNPSASSGSGSGSKNSDEVSADDDVEILDGRKEGSARKTRGRPAGSKNKPKPPIIVARESPTTLRSNILEVAPGADVGAAIEGLARRRQRGISILNGTGTVRGVSLRQPGGAVSRLGGEFEIINLSGAFLPPPSPVDAGGMTAFLLGAEGQIVGGRVVEEMVASGTVTIIAASFAHAAFERIPLAVDIAAAALGAEEEEEGQPRKKKSKHGGEKSPELDLGLDLDLDVGDADPWAAGVLTDPPASLVADHQPTPDS